MSGATDSGMMKTMGMVMGALALLAVVCITAARLLGLGGESTDDPIMRKMLLERIGPVGSVRTSADELPGGGEAELVAEGPKTGDELINGACAACHAAGVAGAPKLGDEGAWAERRNAGLDALVASVINGKGSMPARGGSAYSDEEIKLAVQTMALFEVEEAPAEATQDDSAAAESTEATDVAAVEVVEDTANAAAETATEVAESATEAVSDAANATTEAVAEVTETAAEAVAETAEAATDTATAAAGAAAGAAASAVASVTDTVAETAESATETVAEASGAAGDTIVVGQVPEGVTDNIKANVDGVCAGCHLAGVAGAPKTGDREAWQERASKGLAALVDSVVNGLNVMPPRGGSGLTDDEIPVAILYLMSK